MCINLDRGQSSDEISEIPAAHGHKHLGFEASIMGFAQDFLWTLIWDRRAFQNVDYGVLYNSRSFLTEFKSAKHLKSAKS